RVLFDAVPEITAITRSFAWVPPWVETPDQETAVSKSIELAKRIRGRWIHHQGNHWTACTRIRKL
ncbi:hypothetical protein, partial [Delftia sp. ZNC0008]|uniref:hypothetical protein n=1 Tax=Delftia sp. ZNC0008 TaxID=1339242 RepID=UPI001E3BFB7A